MGSLPLRGDAAERKSDKSTTSGLIALKEATSAVLYCAILRSVTKAHLVDQVAAAAEVTKQDAENIVSSLFAVVSKALQSGDKLEIRGFGSFKVRDRKARQARNPRTGEAIQVPAQRVAAFKPSKELAALLNPSASE